MTAAALIRNTAMELFAVRGINGVSVRDVAAAATVSPSLVMHHYKSKDGLKSAIDEHVTAALANALVETATAAGDELSASLATRLAEAFGAEPVVLAYLRRLLVDGGPAAGVLFGALFDATFAAMDELASAGLLRPMPDPRLRAMFLLVNDLALLLLRDQIEAALGVDPLSKDGLAQWSETVVAAYTHGVFADAGAGAGS